MRQQFGTRLAALGVPATELESALDRLERALVNTLDDERGRWLLTPHPEQETEFALTGLDGDRIVNVALDRTFVDNGVRWIVDYKTSLHEGAGVDEFLDNERARYAGQLERYAKLMRALDTRPIRLGLYFPLLGGWREWSWGERAMTAGRQMSLFE